MEYIGIGDLLSKQFKDGLFMRYDVVVRYLFIKKFYSKNKPKNFNFKLYNRLAKARGRSGKRGRFIELISSFEKNGFLEKYPLIVKRNFCMCGGSHRLACCLWFNIKKVPIEFNKKNNKIKQLFTKEWLLKKGFEDVMPKLDRFKNNIFSKFNVVIDEKNKH